MRTDAPKRRAVCKVAVVLREMKNVVNGLSDISSTAASSSSLLAWRARPHMEDANA